MVSVSYFIAFIVIISRKPFFLFIHSFIHISFSLDLILSTSGEDSNQDCITMKRNCDKEILKVQRLQENVRNLTNKLECAWSDAWSIANAASVKLGYAATNSLEALPQFDTFNSLPRFVDVSSSSVWPVLYLYPQYNQIDINHGVNGEDMLVEHMASMFPEPDDGITYIHIYTYVHKNLYTSSSSFSSAV